MTGTPPQTPEPQAGRKRVHGYTGPTTPAEDAARLSDHVAPHEKAAIGEAASREEDA